MPGGQGPVIKNIKGPIRAGPGGQRKKGRSSIALAVANERKVLRRYRSCTGHKVVFLARRSMPPRRPALPIFSEGANMPADESGVRETRNPVRTFEGKKQKKKRNLPALAAAWPGQAFKNRRNELVATVLTRVRGYLASRHPYSEVFGHFPGGRNWVTNHSSFTRPFVVRSGANRSGS